MNCQIKKILKKKPHLAPVPSGYLESLLNYVDIYEASNEESSEEDTSVTGEEDTASTTSTCSRREYSNMFENIKEPAGAWGTHRFEEHPWSDYDRPSVKLEEYENLILDDEKLGILTDPIISSSLSYLERSPYDLKYVLCKCILSHKLLKDISALKYYHYIQYLDLSRNKLTTLAPLGQLPFLQHLNASHNHIRKLLDFKAPFYLSFVDFSHNLIRTIPDLTEFWSLTQLNVSNNGIIKISGLEKLRYLNYLDLSHNKIVTLENLNNLRIQFLILHHNAIDNIEEKNNMDLKTLCYIRSVDLSNNNLSSLKIFQIAENVENIDMSTNKISSLLELYYLKNLRYLSTLNLSNNPVSEIDFYFNVCLIMIKNLMKLDGEEITAEDRIKIKRNDEIDPLFHAGESHIDLILLQQINHPCIGAHIIPYDQPPPIVFILVGPPGSRKREIVKMICSRNKKCVYGVSHTTRPRTDDEIDGEDYYFVSNEEFKSLTRKGQFIAVSEFNGYSFGIVHEELKKCEDRIFVFPQQYTFCFIT
ncbi:hypothetical protein NQ314_013740 [Rhamnusium bicolor]|uniref:Dynein axonemal assembly factor 1 homolog n=1 Tax=Rhamnusium bicolor TaxID=1586634 RepID=A0AAV8X5S4_9CUCU|nr:hypothetical protein NQ314_013740 [Rhamnusium bicolor]